MATITAGVRDALINIYIGMFKAAPGATDLSTMVTQYESGKTQKQIAAEWAKMAAFNTTYPALLLPSEFADSLVAWMAPEATAAGKSWATNWIISQVQAGKTRADIIVEASNALTAATNLTDFGAAKQAHANRLEVARYYSVTKQVAPSSTSVLNGVTSDTTTVATAKTAVDGQAAAATGQTYTLTSGVDVFTGGVGNDVFNGVIDGTTGAVATTFSGLDSIDGGDGRDTLNLNIVNGNGAADTAVTALPSVVVKNVEVANVRSAVDLTASFTSWTGLTDLNVTQSGAAAITAAATTDVKVSGATGAVTIQGGASQTVETSANAAVTLGATTATKGAVNVTHTAQAANGIAVTGGSDVTVTASGRTTGTIDIGAAAATDPTGAVKVTSTGLAYDAADAANALGAITIQGGTSVVVNQTAYANTTAAATDTSNVLRTQSAVTVDGAGTATSVTVTQSKADAGANAVLAVAGVREAQVVDFAATTDMGAGETLTINGLTFTAAKTLTAAEVAAAFANLSAGATFGSAPASQGSYSGTFNAALANGVGMTSGARDGTKVTFTEGTASATAFNLGITAGAGVTAPTASALTTGVTAVTAVTGRAGIAGGVVTITDSATTDKISSVTLSGAATGSAITSDALKTLSVSDTAGTLAVTNGTANSVLDLTVSGLSSGASVDTNANNNYVTVNMAVNGASTFGLLGNGIKTLNVSGSAVANISGATGVASALAALETVTVTGSAGINLGSVGGTTIKSFDASGSTGAVTATIDSTLATYTGSKGTDTLTLTNTAPNKAINLGDGNDVLILAAGTTSIGASGSLNGGAGEDTLTMVAADAVTASGSTAFAAKVTGFEVLAVTGATGAQSIDLEALGNYAKVASNASAGTLTLNNMASGGTLTITGSTAGTGYTVAVKNAATGTDDSFNIAINNSTSTTAATPLTGGTVTVADVEKINITVTDGVTSTRDTHTLTLVATKATALVITGNAGLNLTNTGNTALKSIDASAATGPITVTAAGTVATTITGGSGNDTLTASTGTVADVLIGGAGNDRLIANAGLTQMTGGAGNDTFVINVASSNSSSYSTIKDFTVGDRLEMTGVTAFSTTKITLASTAVFQDYVNAAINAVGLNGATWFQFGSNTYVVADMGADGTSFLNGTDFIVELTGLIDLTNAVFNSTTGTIALV